MRLRRQPPPLLRMTVVAAVAVVLVVIGFVLGWRLAPESTTETEIGRVSFEVSPSLTGEATAVIPVADWGFRADAFDAPFELGAELRSLERSVIGRAADGDLSILGTTEDQLESGARTAVLEAFAWGSAGALVTLALATLIWRALRPRWLLLAVGAALTVSLSAASLVAARSSFDPSAFEQPTYFANGAELERILAIAEEERVASPYGSTFRSILHSVSSVLAGAPGRIPAGRDIYLGSDLHANALVVEPLSTVIGDGPVLLAGDFGQRGGIAEARLLVPRIAALGSNLLATSGNHDTGSLMRALAERGVEVLGRGETNTPGAARIEGLTVVGFPDPLEWNGPGDPDDRPITFEDLPEPEDAFNEAAAALIDGFDALASAPDVVVIHQEALARALAEELHAREYSRNLVIATGHSHRQRLERLGPIVIVNGGSVGAGGIFDAGRAPIGLAQLHFEAAAPLLRSVDLISVEPFSGQAQASRVVISELCPDEERCSYEPPGLAGEVLDSPAER